MIGMQCSTFPARRRKGKKSGMGKEQSEIDVSHFNNNFYYVIVAGLVAFAKGMT